MPMAMTIHNMGQSEWHCFDSLSMHFNGVSDWHTPEPFAYIDHSDNEHSNLDPECVQLEQLHMVFQERTYSEV